MFTFSAEELREETPLQKRFRETKAAEIELVKTLLVKHETRQEQIREWKKVTGKCRRIFERRMKSIADAA